MQLPQTEVEMAGYIRVYALDARCIRLIFAITVLLLYSTTDVVVFNHKGRCCCWYCFLLKALSIWSGIERNLTLR